MSHTAGRTAAPLGGCATGGVSFGASGGIVGALLADEVALVAAASARPVTVLDCGGGSGRYAVPLALAGADVLVVDVSADALSTLARRASEAGVAEQVRPLQGDIEDLAAVLEEAVQAGAADAGARFDLVLAHGILDVVDSVEATFAAIVATVRPGGAVSVLVANPAAGVLARVLAGDLDAAERELGDLRAERVGAQLIEQLGSARGLVVEQRQGVGVFADLVPGRALDEPGGRATLERLEATCARRAPFADIAAAVHLLLRAP